MPALNQITARALERVRKENPLIHNMTNTVVTNFVANGLLAIGASPVMAYAKQEVVQMAKTADALVLNMGTLTEEKMEAMILAGQSANENGTPVILDPVGVGATSYRKKAAKRILSEVKVTVVRGNAAEIANIIDEKRGMKGVDAPENIDGNLTSLAKRAAVQLSTVIVMTGKEDIVTDGRRTFIIKNGHPILTKVTGTGCLLTAVIGAFTAVNDNILEASMAALAFYGLAAETAVKTAGDKVPGVFQIEFLNQLARVGGMEVEQAAIIQELSS